VTASGHGWPLRHLLPALQPRARRWSYEWLVRRTRLPKGTWVFTDHERLSAFEMSVAASVAQQLREAGCKVLNHPAEFKSRFTQLDALWRAGINQFRVFHAEESPTPSCFPVFIRREYDHDGNDRALIHSQAELDAVLAHHRTNGVSLNGHLVIEFASEEASPGIWYRGSAYRVGDTIIAHHMALDDRWLVKDGFDARQLDVYKDRAEFLERERAMVMGNEHSELLRRAFDIAGIEYGRADFGFLGDKIQIYEINTNPTHGSARKVFGNIHPGREPTQRFSEQRLRDALNAVNTDTSGNVFLKGSLLAFQRRIFPLFLPLMMRRP
jgi:hypothetical protein